MNFALPGWLWAGLQLAAAVAIGLALHTALVLALRRLVNRERAPMLKPALEQARVPSRIGVVPLALLLAVPTLRLTPGTEALAMRFLGIALVVAVGWTLIRMTSAAFDSAWARRGALDEEDVETRRRITQLNLARRLSVGAIGLVTFGLVLTAVPSVRNLGLSLFASAGAAGIVVGLAARPAISNLIAGIQIALSQPIRIGDVVVLEGEWGRVEEIGSTYVVVEIWDQRRLILPLSYFLEKPFQNWTRTSPRILGTVMLHVDYSVPVEALRSRLHEILQATPLWDGRVWNLQVVELRDQTVELRALVSAANAAKNWDLRCHIREEMVRYIMEAFPQGLPRSRLAVLPEASGLELRRQAHH
ncbi:MAG TPA: mechanosensitive ion channel domain-containing protein [Alphaproteobacteria bacterium]|nr:mechanosensitive ion channel domain-containing protein [Alphaproteobacteria bacterium]